MDMDRLILLLALPLALLLPACGGGAAPRLQNPWTWEGPRGEGAFTPAACEATRVYATNVLVPALGHYLRLTGGLPYRLEELDVDLRTGLRPPGASHDAWAYRTRIKDQEIHVDLAFCRGRWRDRYGGLPGLWYTPVWESRDVWRLRARLDSRGQPVFMRWSHEVPVQGRD